MAVHGLCGIGKLWVKLDQIIQSSRKIRHNKLVYTIVSNLSTVRHWWDVIFYQIFFGEIWSAFIKLKIHPWKDNHFRNVFIATRHVILKWLSHAQQLILKSQGNNHKINISYLEVLLRKLLRNNDNPITEMYKAANIEVSLFLYVEM